MMTYARRAVLISTVKALTRVAKLAWNLWVDKEAFVAVCALWEEFTIVLRVHKLTLSLCLVAFGPVLASNLYFAGGSAS